MTTLIIAAILVLGVTMLPAQAADAQFGPQNPFYAPSTLPFQAPPFDKIKDADYQPAIEAGMAEQKKEMEAIANNPAAPTFENTFITDGEDPASCCTGRQRRSFRSAPPTPIRPCNRFVRRLLRRWLRMRCHPPRSQAVSRVAAIYKERESLKLDPESLRLVEVTYDEFVHAGANLSDADKSAVEEAERRDCQLSTEFSNKLLAATKAGAYVTTDKAALAGFSDAQIAAAAEAAKGRKVEGYVIPLQNTTQQPDLRQPEQSHHPRAAVENSWNRAEKGDANDTRDDHREDRAASRAESEAAGLFQLCRLEAGRPDGQEPQKRP